MIYNGGTNMYEPGLFATSAHGIKSQFGRSYAAPDSIYLFLKAVQVHLPFLRILVWYSCFNIIIKLSYPILS